VCLSWCCPFCGTHEFSVVSAELHAMHLQPPVFAIFVFDLRWNEIIHVSDTATVNLSVVVNFGIAIHAKLWNQTHARQEPCMRTES
jgi:hypothetical protein